MFVHCIPLFHTKEGIKVVETTLKRKNKPTRAIITFLKLILTLNSFIFNCKNYLQTYLLWEINAYLPMSKFSGECLKKTN